MIRFIAALSATCLLAASCQGPRVPDGDILFSFGRPAVGRVETTWTVAETNGKGSPATWRVEDAVATRILRLAETKNAGQTYNLALLPGERPADLELSVRLRADSGREDQGGGLLWRARGPDDYYIARWNPLEDNLRVYTVAGGRRKQLASADIKADPSQWHRLWIQMVGTHIRVRFDGTQVLELDDATFAGGGQIGFWTKADAATSFDDLRLMVPHSVPKQ